MDAHSVLVFRQVARTGSMTAAAAALGWTQPAVSQHVRRLERALGTALLLRHGRTTRLTEAGEVLARHAESVAASLAVAEREVADLVGRRAGRVRLHAFSSALATLVPAALALLAARHPGIDARTIEALPPQAEAAVRDGTCDLALVFGYDAEPAHDDLDVVPLRTEPLYAVLPAGHPLAGCDEVTVARLAGEAWIAGCETCRAHHARLAAAAGFTLDVRHTTDDYLVAQGLVAAGLGVTLLPAPSLAAVRHPGVVAVPLRGERFHVRVLVRPQTARVPAVQALLEALRAAAAT
jgi:DNA-binding transcriptional LysR family regulator